MDISARKVFWETVKELANHGKTIIFSTHYLQEADDVAELIYFIQQREGHCGWQAGRIKRQFVETVGIICC